MIYSVVMQQGWLPSQIDSLFLDNQDHWGLGYWYDNVKQYAKELNESIKGKS